MEACYRHPNRETGVSCSNCERPICPECMTSTPVGMRCPECAGQTTKVRTAAAIGRRAGQPNATYALLALNVIAYLAGSLSGGGDREMGVEAGLCINAIGEGGFCGIDRSNVILSQGGEVWRLVSYGFLHFGLPHLLFNMFALYFLGTLLEPAIGTARFLGIYVAGLLAGSLGALLLSSEAGVTVGASGAVFGLMAAAFVIARHRGVEEIASQIAIFVGLNLFITFALPGISIGGHLGGLVGGGLAALLVSYGERRAGGREASLIEIGGMVLICVVSVVGALVVASGASTGLPA